MPNGSNYDKCNAAECGHIASHHVTVHGAGEPSDYCVECASYLLKTIGDVSVVPIYLGRAP